MVHSKRGKTKKNVDHISCKIRFDNRHFFHCLFQKANNNQRIKHKQTQTHKKKQTGKRIKGTCNFPVPKTTFHRIEKHIRRERGLIDGGGGGEGRKRRVKNG